MRRKKIPAFPLGAFAIVLLLGGLLASCGSSSPGSAEAPSEASAQRKQKAPDFRLTDLNGKTFSLHDYRGKVVFLDFWATWCPPCVVSAPEVEKLAADYREKDVEVISISLDDRADKVERFIASHGLTTRVALAGESGVDARYGVRGIPTFFIIDKKGNLAGAWDGFHPSFAAVWRKELDRLLKI